MAPALEQITRHVAATDHADPPASSGGTELASTLVKGLDILALLASGETLGNQQIAQRAGLSKPTASRLCTTLTTLGYLRKDERTRKYAMGARLLAMGATVQYRAAFLTSARPYMDGLARDTGMTVGMGTRERLGMVCLDVARSAGTQDETTGVGSLLPMTETAMGLAYLSDCTVAERIALLRQLQLVYDSGWNTVRERIEQAHAQNLRLGYVIRPPSREADVNEVAAAIELPGQFGIVVFNCTTRADGAQVTARLHRAGEALREMLATLAGETESPLIDLGSCLAVPKMMSP